MGGNWRAYGCGCLGLTTTVAIIILGMISVTPRQNAIYYVTVHSANVRSCEKTTCKIIGGLERGDEIESLGQATGEKPNGYNSNIWIEFSYNGTPAFVHSELVSSPTNGGKQQPASTRGPTATATDEILYADSCSSIRTCPRYACKFIYKTSYGDKIKSLGSVNGQKIYGNDQWIKFKYNGRIAYIWSGDVSSSVRYSPYPTPPQRTYTCNCSKTCSVMTCSEAYFQLNNCGCSARDNDRDGIPCEVHCPCS